MVRAARAMLATSGEGQYAFDSKYGHCELCAINRDVAGVWTRGMIDFYGSRMPVGVQVWDYKTTSGNANPAQQAAHMESWSLQAAMYERIVCQLKPELAGRIKFRFLVQETEEPYLCSIVEPSAQAMMVGHKRVAAAIAIFNDCLTKDRWDSYSNKPVEVSVRSWAEQSWIARELTDDKIKLAANDPWLAAAAWMPAEPAPVLSELPPPATFATAASDVALVAPVPPPLTGVGVALAAGHDKLLEDPLPPYKPPPVSGPYPGPYPMPGSEPEPVRAVRGRGKDGAMSGPGKPGRPRGQRWTEAQKQAAREREARRRLLRAAEMETLAPPVDDDLPPPKRIEL
jgi:hypothetical protein